MSLLIVFDIAIPAKIIVVKDGSLGLYAETLAPTTLISFLKI